jgi:NTP pyrophosphatase (non-canonical NTP hydrolase)
MHISLGEFANAQKDWSEKTFGPAEHRGPLGPLKHLAKEAVESQEAIGSDHLLEELADCLFLLIDAAWRSGYWTDDLLGAAYLKLEKNKERTWPDWRKADANAPIEHVRS